jgi:hypothetical protein
MDIVVWLRSLGLGRYEAIFRDNDIDEAVLPSLTHENLKELGVASFGHRVKLLDAIAALRPSSDLNTAISAPSPEDRAERRQVTVMFSDLVGSMALYTLREDRHHAADDLLASKLPAADKRWKRKPPNQLPKISLGTTKRASFQNQVQASAAFFQQRHSPEIPGVVVGVFLYFVDRDRRRLAQRSRHVLRRQRQDEGHGVVGTGAVGEGQMAAYVALVADKLEPLRHLVLGRQDLKFIQPSATCPHKAVIRKPQNT